MLFVFAVVAGRRGVVIDALRKWICMCLFSSFSFPSLFFCIKSSLISSKDSKVKRINSGNEEG